MKLINLENIKKDWIFKVFYFSLMLVVLLIATTSFFENDYTLQIPTQSLFANITYAVVLCLGIVFYFIIKFFEKKNIKLEKLYLVLVIPIGILYCIANPLGKIPDEDQHARKSMAISKGIFFAHMDENGNPVDKLNTKVKELVTRSTTSYEEAINRINMLETDEEIDLVYSMATYAPICHLPQAFGMFITRILGGGVSVQCYTARLINMFVAIFFIYEAIKLIPFKKNIVFFLALLPLTISEFASMSSDALTISSCIFYISYILYLKYDENKNIINKKDIIVLIISSIIVSLLKIVYVPLCLLLFILPKEKFDSAKNKNIIVISTFISAIVLNIIWLIYASRFLTEVNPGVNAVEQVKYILTHPISYILILFRTIHVYFQIFIFSLCGEGLGDYNVQASVFFIISSLIVFAILFLANDNKDKRSFDVRTKIVCSLIFIIVVLLIYTSLYVAWTKLKSPIILGIQARYFLPILLLTAIVLDNKLLTINTKIKDKYLASFMLFFNLNALSCITYTYIFSYIIEYYVK